jgi:uncharacterized membrane protein YheB (UPF0754 family)
MPEIEKYIDAFLKNKLSDTFPLLSMFISDKTINQLKKSLMDELAALFPQVMQQYMSNLRQDLDLEKIVTKKVQEFSSDKLELILNDIMKKEFRFVEIIGAVLGFIIGIFQVLLSLLSN